MSQRLGSAGSGRHRLAILTDGHFTPTDAKTAIGVIRYGPHDVVALIDSQLAGRNLSEYLPGHRAPFVPTLGEAIALQPTALLVGIAPDGGRLPAEWRTLIADALRAGLDVLSGLHTFLDDDPELRAAAAAGTANIIDYRRLSGNGATATGRRHRSGSRVILTVGTDCAIGKMTVGLELGQAATRAGRRSVFVPTGQTGMMIAGWGAAVDREISDFLNGTVEQLVTQGEERGDWIFVEGQGSLDHPAYSPVTLGLIHGATPHAMVMVHRPGIDSHDFAPAADRTFPLQSLPGFIALHERVAALVAPSKVVAVALNTHLMASDDAARRAIETVAEETGLPTDDPVRFGAEGLWTAIESAVESLSWVHGPER